MSDKALEDTIGETSVGLRRRAYLIAFLTVFLAGVSIFLNRYQLNPYVRIAYPMLMGVAFVFFILIVRKVSFNLIERISTIITMVSVVGEFIYTLFFLPSGFKIEQELSIGWFWLCLVVIQMVHLAFDTRQALQIGLSLYAVLTVLGLLKFVPESMVNHDYQKFLIFVRYLAFAATSFALIQVLASSKELLALERLRSSIDPLTGAANRRQILYILRTNSVAPLRVAVILLDLDHFKTINDKYGHDVGDHVLRETVRLIKGLILAIEPRATIGRWGGEEFLIIVPGSSLEEAAEFADHIRKRLQVHPFKVISRVTASFGVAYLKPDERVSSVVKRADEALYQAKTFGRNRIELSRSAPHDTADLLNTDVTVTIA